MVMTLWALFLAAGAATAFVLTVLLVKAHPTFGLYMLGGVALIAWEIPNLQPLISIGGANIFPQDVMLGCLTLAVLPRVVQHFKLGGSVGVLALLLLALGALSTIRGSLDYSPQAAVNDLRTFAYVGLAFFWALAVNWRLYARSVLRWARWTTILLAVATSLHIATYGLGSSTGAVDLESGIEQTTRPLVAGQALLVLMLLVLLLPQWERRANRLLIVLLVLMLAVSQQRSVWVAALIALGASLLATRGTSRLRVLSAIASLTTAALVGLLFGGLQSSTALSTGTYDARARSWVTLISQAWGSGLFDVLFGRPMGAGYGRFEGPGRYVEFAPHNFYVSVFLRLGAIGVIAAAGVVIYLGRTALRRRDAVAFSIVCACLAFSWTYSFVWYIAPVCVVAVAMSRQAIPATAHSLPPPVGARLTTD